MLLVAQQIKLVLIVVAYAKEPDNLKGIPRNGDAYFNT